MVKAHTHIHMRDQTLSRGAAAKPMRSSILLFDFIKLTSSLYFIRMFQYMMIMVILLTIIPHVGPPTDEATATRMSERQAFLEELKIQFDRTQLTHVPQTETPWIFIIGLLISSAILSWRASKYTNKHQGLECIRCIRGEIRAP